MESNTQSPPGDADKTDAVDDPVILKRQAIVDGKGRLAAYDLSLELGEGEAEQGPGAALRALAGGLNQVFSGAGFDALLGQFPGYLHLDVRVITSGMLEVLPPRKVVLAIKGAFDTNGVAMTRIRDLSQRGHWISLDFHDLDQEQLRTALPVLKTLALDFERPISDTTLKSLLGLRGKIALLARNVTHDSQFKDLSARGIDLFQGFYFAPQTTVDTSRSLNPGKAQLLRLLTLILEDADNQKLGDEIKRNPTLSFNLLRLVNSAASGNLRVITSVQQAIVQLGRRQLQRWLNLMLFASGESGTAQNPMLQVAATRARFMELMAEARPQSNQQDKDEAFVTGVLSLVHMLLNTTPQVAVDAIPLAPEVRAALLTREGRLGNLLALAESLETSDSGRTQNLWQLVSYVPMKRMLELQMEAFHWARSLETAAA